VLKYEYLPLDEVLAVLTARPEMLHVVVTGRHAPDARSRIIGSRKSGPVLKTRTRSPCRA
jgi:hypothetical protein